LSISLLSFASWLSLSLIRALALLASIFIKANYQVLIALGETRTLDTSNQVHDPHHMLRLERLALIGISGDVWLPSDVNRYYVACHSVGDTPQVVGHGRPSHLYGRIIVTLYTCTIREGHRRDQFGAVKGVDDESSA
jgi:hypothetical protein